MNSVDSFFVERLQLSSLKSSNCIVGMVLDHKSGPL